MVARRNIKSIGKLVFKRLIFSFFLLFALPVSAATEENTANCLKLGADEGLAAFHPLFENLITSIYRRAGHCVVSISAAPKRIEKMLASGALDGDWMRVEGYADQFNVDLIEIPIPLFQIDAVLLAGANSDFNGTPEDLKDRIVGYHAGFRWVEKSLPALGAIPKEIPLGVPVQELLMRGRFEVFATDGVRAHQILRSQSDGQNRIRWTSWKTISFFHLIHRRHKDKVNALKREIERAIEAGEFDQIFALPGLSRVAVSPN